MFLPPFSNDQPIAVSGLGPVYSSSASTRKTTGRMPSVQQRICSPSRLFHGAKEAPADSALTPMIDIDPRPRAESRRHLRTALIEKFVAHIQKRQAPPPRRPSVFLRERGVEFFLSTVIFTFFHHKPQLRPSADRNHGLARTRLPVLCPPRKAAAYAAFGETGRMFRVAFSFPEIRPHAARYGKIIRQSCSLQEISSTVSFQTAVWRRTFFVEAPVRSAAVMLHKNPQRRELFVRPSTTAAFPLPITL